MDIVSLNSFRGIHKGEKLFMIGTGPSLTYEMLDQLQGQYTFAMNNIAIAFPHTEWRPYYYLNVSRSLMKYPDWQAYAAEASRTATHSFYWERNLLHVSGTQHGGIQVSFMSCHDWPVFETDCWNNGISRWGTSMFSALQLAVYMGFSRIYLIGCDLGYQNGMDMANMKDNFHFDENYLGKDRKLWAVMNPGSMALDEARTVTAHQLTVLVVRRLGRWIFTCSPRLEGIYPLRSFEEALEDDGKWLVDQEYRHDYRAT